MALKKHEKMVVVHVFSAENCNLMVVAFNGMQQQNQPWKSAKN
jgi:hypothetical protein